MQKSHGAMAMKAAKEHTKGYIHCKSCGKMHYKTHVHVRKVAGEKYKKYKKMTPAEDRAYDKKHNIKPGSKKDNVFDRLHGIKKKGLKLNPPSKGHTPKGAHGRAAVHALGRTKTTGNFAKIEKARGKGAAIVAYQNALKSHRMHKKGFSLAGFPSSTNAVRFTTKPQFPKPRGMITKFKHVTKKSKKAKNKS